MTLEIVRGIDWGKRLPTRPNVAMKPDRMLGVAVHVIQSGVLRDVDGGRRMANIQRWHMDNNGWSDIAYAYGVGFDGTIYEGQRIGSAGFAEGKSRSGRAFKTNHNPLWVSVIALHGTGNDPSTTMIESMYNLCQHITSDLRSRGNTNPLAVLGHCQILYNRVPGDIKPCPGQKWLDIIAERDFAAIPEPVSTAWYNDHPDWLAAQNKGITDGSRPSEPATRAEAAVMAIRAARLGAKL